MDSYLDIAARILRTAKRPMTGRQILERAYASRLVPSELYGKTQHKTLQARLSEDILRKREESVFFRTKPGYFFLREFIQDESLPPEHRTPIAARRRIRDLFVGPALALRQAFVRSLFEFDTNIIPATKLLEALDPSSYSYVDPKRKDTDLVLLWAAASVVRGTQVLCYRVGRYRDGREAFAHKRSIAFSSLVEPRDHSLFTQGSLGIEESALRAAVTDLDIPIRPSIHLGGVFRHELRSIMVPTFEKAETGLLAFVVVECPTWYEPVTRRLSLNDLHWLDLSVPPNNLDDFDPWSQRLITELVESHFDRRENARATRNAS